MGDFKTVGVTITFRISVPAQVDVKQLVQRVKELELLPFSMFGGVSATPPMLQVTDGRE